MPVCVCGACGHYYVTEDLTSGCGEACRACGGVLHQATPAEVRRYIQEMKSQSLPSPAEFKIEPLHQTESDADSSSAP